MTSLRKARRAARHALLAQRQRARLDAIVRMQREERKRETLRRLGKDISSCGCVWQRDPKFGDVVVAQCDTHRSQGMEAARAIDVGRYR